VPDSIYHLKSDGLAESRSSSSDILQVASLYVDFVLRAEVLNLFVFDYEFLAPDHWADGVVGCQVEGLVIEVATGQHLLALLAPLAFWFAVGMTHLYQLPFRSLFWQSV
jgi:hypothetical protein